MPRWLWLSLAAADLAAYGLTYFPAPLEARGVQGLSLALSAALTWWLYDDAICWGWAAVVAAASILLFRFPPELLALRYYAPVALTTAIFLVLSRRRRGWAPAVGFCLAFAFLPASLTIRAYRRKAAAREKASIKTALNEGRVLLAQAEAIHDINKINEAATRLQEAIDKDPLEWEAYRLLFVAAHDVGDMAAAVPYDQRLLAHHAQIAAQKETEDPLWYFTRLGYLAFKNSDDQAALAAADEAVDADATLDSLTRMVDDHDERAKLIQETDAALAALSPERRSLYAEIMPVLESAKASQERSATTVQNARFFLHKVVGYRSWHLAFVAYAHGMDALNHKKDAYLAEAFFNNAVKEAPLYAEPQMALAEIALSRGENDRAADLTKAAVEALEGPGPTSLASRNELLTRAHALHGTARWRSAQKLAVSSAAFERMRAIVFKSEAAADLKLAQSLGVNDPFAASLALELKPAR